MHFARNIFVIIFLKFFWPALQRSYPWPWWEFFWPAFPFRGDFETGVDHFREWIETRRRWSSEWGSGSCGRWSGSGRSRCTGIPVWQYSAHLWKNCYYLKIQNWHLFTDIVCVFFMKYLFSFKWYKDRIEYNCFKISPSPDGKDCHEESFRHQRNRRVILRSRIWIRPVLSRNVSSKSITQVNPWSCRLKSNQKYV